MNFELLNDEINAGLTGRNSDIPMGFNRLNSYIGIRKRIYFLIGGYTGSGKTTFIDDAFVLNPYDWWMKNKDTTSAKFRIIYRSMERSRVYKIAKWLSRRVFLDHGIIIPIKKLLGWTRYDRLSHDEHDLCISYKDYFDEMEEYITIIDGPENPVGVAKELRIYAEEHGKIEHVDKFNKVYIPDDPDEITMIVLDNFNNLKTTKDQPTKKAAIDKMSDELRQARDLYGYTIAAVNQFNREISNPIRLKNGDVEPCLEDNHIWHDRSIN